MDSQFRQCRNAENPMDTGTGTSITSSQFLRLVNGKTVNGLGQGASNVSIKFSGNSAIYFFTRRRDLHVVYSDPPLPGQLNINWTFRSRNR